MDTNKSDFETELEALLNKYSRGTTSNTPDIILVDYLTDCLTAYNKAVIRRTHWHTYAEQMVVDI